MIVDVPKETDTIYEDFKKAIMEQINYFEENPELINGASNGGYTLGSYSEGNSNQDDNSKSINKISPVAYDILLNCGLLYCGLRRC